jgi:hypothetical protein
MKKNAKNLKSEDIEGSPRYKRLYQAIEGKPFNKKNQRFTGQKDVDFIILQKIDDLELSNLCVINSYVNDLCKDETFWRNRLLSKYGFLLGDTKEIINKYKPEDISWKEYYIWLNSSLDGDQFFTYLFADALGRKDVTMILEYEFPQYFNEMDKIYMINDNLRDKINSKRLTPSVSLLKSARIPMAQMVNLIPNLKINFPDIRFLTKKTLMYLLAIFVLEENGKKLSKEKRHIYNISLFDEENLEPLNIIQKMFDELLDLPPGINLPVNYDKIMEKNTDIFRKHFNEIGIESDNFKNEFRNGLITLGLVSAAAIGGYVLTSYFDTYVKNLLGQK